MTSPTPHMLVINGGSSSIKFAVYTSDESMTLTLQGKMERIGIAGTKFSFSNTVIGVNESSDIDVKDFKAAVKFLVDWLRNRPEIETICAIGHRVVHGMNHTEPEIITPELLKELHQISSYDPDHLPSEIALIEVFGKAFVKVPQVACFDTAFHADMPRVAKLLPIPRRFDAQGIQRYGFHGISYTYLMEELARVAGKKLAAGRLILAHLGSGSSMAAVLKGKSIDTSMGFTPTGGIVMGSRPGDLDPGVAWFMMQREKLNQKEFNDLINHQSGLLGISETSGDMHDLLKIENDDIRAAEAIALFCYDVKKYIGSYSAVLGGIDALVFTGGIGEKSPVIRQSVCAGLDYLGIKLNPESNGKNAAVISDDNSPVLVRIIETNEEVVIARSVLDVLKNANSKK